jgi:hypothetical protein
MGAYQVREKVNGQPETIEISADRIIRTVQGGDDAGLVETYSISSVIEWGHVRKRFRNDVVIVTFEAGPSDIRTFDWEVKSGRDMFAELEERVQSLGPPADSPPTTST